IKAQVTKGGAKGVVHGNRGRPCKRKTPEKKVRRVVELARGKYLGFNDHHLTEKLAEQEKLEISRETVSRILRSSVITSPRKVWVQDDRMSYKHETNTLFQPKSGVKSD